MLTPIHRALGVEPGDLSADLLRQAVEAEVRESEDLDWKQTLYRSKDPHWRDEAAKDIAAMANSSGGWLVFGVKDREDAAAAITPVEWSGVDEQRLRQIAYAHIGPPVVGLTFTVLDVDGGSVVAMRVPASPEAPHLARKGADAFVAPRRNGAHTVFMSERELERSYRARFRTRADQEEALETLYRETARAMEPENGVCLVFVGMPDEPLVGRPSMTEQQARTLLDYIDHSSFYEGDSAIDHGPGNYRRGLRRWVTRSTKDPENRDWRMTVHEDGTVTVAYRLGGWDVGERGASTYPRGEPNHCVSVTVEQAVARSVNSVVRVANELQVEGGYTARTGLVGRSGEPIYVRSTERVSNHLLATEHAEPIHDFHPVTVDFDPLASTDALLPLIREICLDIVNQGGVRNLRAILDVPGASF